MQTPGYKFSYRNKNERWGAGVRLYIIDSIKCKVHHDMNKIHETMEYIWIECKGGNCNKKHLVGVLY